MLFRKNFFLSIKRNLDKIILLSLLILIATLPSLDEIRAKLVSLIQTPARNIAYALKFSANKLARVFNEYSKLDIPEEKVEAEKKSEEKTETEVKTEEKPETEAKTEEKPETEAKTEEKTETETKTEEKAEIKDEKKDEEKKD